MAAAATKTVLSEEFHLSPHDISVTPVQSSSDKNLFIGFPYLLYQGDPNWVPPLIMERKDFLNPARNPWFEFGSVELFIARRAGKVVGRIAAVHDPRYNEYHKSKVGFFGMFEAVNDPEIAAGLFDAASQWCRSKGMVQMMGPAGFSSNYEWAALVEGFDAPPMVMMPYNPAYYPELYTSCGFQKEKDLWAFELSSSVSPPEKVSRVADKIRRREGIIVRPVNLKDYDNEIRKIKDIYNAAWEDNWGFVPMTDKEFDHMAREFRPIAVPELILIAEVRGEPVAFSLTLPDANFALKAANGRLTRYGFPIGLIKLARASRKIKRLRLITLGIKEGFRKRGIDAIMYLDTLRNARQLGYTGGEISWTLEDNQLVNRAIESMGGRKYKTYRIYSRAL